MVCTCCRQALHRDQAEPSAVVTIDQSNDPRRTYRLCGECVVKIETMLMGRHRAIPFPDPVMHSVTRNRPA